MLRLNKLSLLVVIMLAACGGGGSDKGGESNHLTQNEIVSPGKTPATETLPVTVVPNPGLHDAPPVRTGVLDSGVNRFLTNLNGRVNRILRYVGQGTYLGSGVYTPDDITDQIDIASLDIAGHGSYVSQIIAGNGDRYSHTGNQHVTLYEAQTTYDTKGHSDIYDQMVALEDLHNKDGVNLFNASWGSDNIYTLNSPVIKTLHNLSASNGLVIFSAGNDGLSEPSAESRTPLVDKSIEDGLISVVGVDDYHHLYRDSPAPDAKGSNACGTAAAWCMAGAYVTDSLLYYLDENYYVTFSGTSGAAPQVTAAAAAVWYKYPWMTASQVKQTLLTTSTNLDDGSAPQTPYNATYGWGLLNALRAENGPALFSSHFGDFDARIPDSHYVFGNDISGDSGLIKEGNGTLELAGKNTYSGKTTISQGTVFVSGSINGGDVDIHPEGTLSGSGSVSTTHNNGTVDLSPGALQVNGNYTQSATGTLRAYIGHRFAITGNASLDGKVNLVNQNYVVNGNYNILQANNIQGRFNQVTNDSQFLTIDDIHYTPDAVNLDVTQVSARNAGITHDPLSATGADVTDSIFSAANTAAARQAKGAPLTDKETALLDYSADLQTTATGDTVQHIVDSNAGALYSELPSVLLAGQNWLTHTVAHRLNATAVVPGIWISHDYLRNRYTPEGWSQIDGTLNNTSVGLDVQVRDDILSGGFVNKNTLNLSLDRNGGELHGTQTGAGLYARYNNAPFYTSGVASYQHGSADIRRLLVDNHTQYAVAADTALNNTGLYLESGYAFHLPGQTELTPFAGIGYDRTRTGDVDENALPGVHASKMEGAQSVATAGTRLNYPMGNTLQIGLYTQLSDILSRTISDVTLSPHFSEDNIVSYAPSLDRQSIDYGLNINYQPSKNIQVAGIAQSSTTDDQTYSVSASLTYVF